MRRGLAMATLLAGVVGGCVSTASPTSTADGVEDAPQGRRSFAMLGSRLEEVAAGRISVPGEAATSSALASAKARIVGRGALSAVQAAASGNVLAMGAGAVGTGMMLGQVAAAEAEVAQAMAQAKASRAATHPVPDADRPAEAQALMTIAGGAVGASASWRNRETGASGVVTIGPGHPSITEMGCQSGTRTYKSGSTSRKGDFLICLEGSSWYDLS